LQETGYIDGQNVKIEFRSAEDQYDKLSGILAELIRRPVAVLVANAVAAQAAKTATTTVPIVFATGSDPVKDDNLVASFNRPGGNITGVTFLNNSLGVKRLELLREVASETKIIGILENPNGPPSRAERASLLTAAQSMGQHVVVVRATQEWEFGAAFAALAREHAGALLVTGDGLFTSRRDRLIALASRHAMPTIHSEKMSVRAGALMSYGTDLADAYRLVGIYAGRILKGDKPGDLPVVQATKFELGINLRTAKTLGLTVPSSVLARADEVIE
jgi:ABC-type uncharacterized transport system substrate-binding protein